MCLIRPGKIKLKKSSLKWSHLKRTEFMLRGWLRGDNPHLVQAIKEQQELIKRQQEQLNEMEAMIEELKRL